MGKHTWLIKLASEIGGKLGSKRIGLSGIKFKQKGPKGNRRLVVTIYHNGNMGDNVKGVSANIDRAAKTKNSFGQLDRLAKRQEDGSPDYQYVAHWDIPFNKIDDETIRSMVSKKESVSQLSRVEEKLGRKLTVPEKHQLKVAYQVMKMPWQMVGITNSISKAEATAIIKKLTGKDYDPKKNEELEEASTSDGAGPYMTPNAFHGKGAFSGGKKSDKEKMKSNATQGGYELVEGKIHLTEGQFPTYTQLSKDEALNPKQKIGVSVAMLNRHLNEISRFVEMLGKLKREQNVTTSDYWKRTHNNLAKITERMTRVMSKVRNLQS